MLTVAYDAGGAFSKPDVLLPVVEKTQWGLSLHLHGSILDNKRCSVINWFDLLSLSAILLPQGEVTRALAITRSVLRTTHRGVPGLGLSMSEWGCSDAFSILGGLLCSERINIGVLFGELFISQGGMLQ